MYFYVSYHTSLISYHTSCLCRCCGGYTYIPPLLLLLSVSPDISFFLPLNHRGGVDGINIIFLTLDLLTSYLVLSLVSLHHHFTSVYHIPPPKTQHGLNHAHYLLPDPATLDRDTVHRISCLVSCRRLVSSISISRPSIQFISPDSSHPHIHN